jgi:hypothetical protein
LDFPEHTTEIEWIVEADRPSDFGDRPVRLLQQMQGPPDPCPENVEYRGIAGSGPEYPTKMPLTTPESLRQIGQAQGLRQV